MAKMVAFAQIGFNGNARQFQSNDPDLTINNEDFALMSAIVTDGKWSLYSQTNYTGDRILLNHNGGPDRDGVYKDYGDWHGSGLFRVRSILARVALS